MNKRKSGILVVGFLGVFLTVIAAPLSAAAQVGVASAKPYVVTTPADVTVTIQLTDTRLIPNSVNLHRLDANGKAVVVLGNLNDQGINGDAVAGDQIFSLRYHVTDTAPALVQVRVSWALKGVLTRAVSNTVKIHAVNLPPNPVAASEKDTTLLGTDADGNGVRDDVEAFITARYADPTQRDAATRYAIAMTKRILATDTDALLAAVQLTDGAQVCFWNIWGLERGQEELRAIKAALFNNQQRMEAYFRSDTNLDGKMIYELNKVICPIDRKSYNGKP